MGMVLLVIPIKHTSDCISAVSLQCVHVWLLASFTGAKVLEEGGNAVDAALTAAIVMVVVEPSMNGLGGDTQALLWQDGQAWGLNSSGKSPVDLANHEVQWVEPVQYPYRGVAVHQLPPNTQRIAVQIALGILAAFEINADMPPAQLIHLQIEAMKIAFADVYAHVGDPGSMQIGAKELLDEAYLRQRA